MMRLYYECKTLGVSKTTGNYALLAEDGFGNQSRDLNVGASE